MKIVILRNFKEDCRISMEHYADQLEIGLSSSIGHENTAGLTPIVPNWLKMIPFQEEMKMRLARFLLYPGQLKKIEADIFHIADHGYAHLINSLKSACTVVTVHDLIPLLAWKGLIKGFKLSKRPILVEYSLRHLRKASKIIAVSKSTKNDLINHLGCRGDQIEVIYNALDKVFYQASKNDQKNLRNSFGLPENGQKIVLVTGSQKYKNHETSVEILKRINQHGSGPVMVIRLGGESFEWDEMVTKAGLKNNSKVFSNLTRERVADLVNCADCLLFPSTYEGFGWPPLEAMACGVPVVASNAASLPEVTGEAALSAPPHDVEALTGLTMKALFNANTRDYLIARGLERAASFKADISIKRIAKLYDEILQTSKK